MIGINKLTRRAATCLLLGISSFAMAEDDRVIEEVTVTGSYIKGSAEDAASPIQVISREDIDVQSAVTIDDITKNLTINSGSTTNHNYDTENATISGKANVNLRGLGLNSTLVLFNGKRQSVAAAVSQDGSEFVDVNTIPLVMLERVEILKDGGSAIYGSDAIAGVVNFILRDDYEGFQIAGDITSSDRADAEDMTFSALWGTSFNDDKTHIVIGGEYFERDPYGFLDLDIVDATDRVTTANSTFTAIIPGAIPGFSDLNPAYFNAVDSAISGSAKFTDPLCAQLGYSTGLFSDPVNDPNNHCREDTRAYRGAQIEQERYSVGATFKHEFSDNLELYGMVHYNDQDIKRPTTGSFGSIDSLQAILPVGDPIWGLGSRSPGVIAATGGALVQGTADAGDPTTVIGGQVAAAGAAAGAAAFTAALTAGSDLATAGAAAQAAGAAAGGATAAALIGAAAIGANAAALPRPTNAPILLANGGPNSLSYMGYGLSKLGDFSFHPEDSKSNSKTCLLYTSPSPRDS